MKNGDFPLQNRAFSELQLPYQSQKAGESVIDLRGSLKEAFASLRLPPSENLAARGAVQEYADPFLTASQEPGRGHEQNA